MNFMKQHKLFSHVHTIMSQLPCYVSRLSCSNPDLEEVKSRFRTVGKGSVVLTKDESQGIAFLEVINPERKNGISGKMMCELSDAVTELGKWRNGKGIILHSPGDTFCSGGDLTTVREIFSPYDGFCMSYLMQDSLLRFQHLPLISVAIVQGKALGGGAEFAIASDFRLFTPKGELAFVQAKMGVATGWGGGTRLVHLLGYRKALDVLTTCRRIDASEAMSLGLADAIVSESNTLQAGVQWLSERTKHEAAVVGAIKEIALGATERTVIDSLENERRVFAPLWSGEAQKNALAQNIKHK